MKRKYVQSSSIQSVGYDDVKKILEIEFRSHEVYDYFDVPKSKYMALLTAPSMGAYFVDNIRNCYEFEQR